MSGSKRNFKRQLKIRNYKGKLKSSERTKEPKLLTNVVQTLPVER